ncbi:MAG: 3-deoxy-D-manno-octulosonic acid transferase [Alcaligenaceae bacterium]|nr:3-deoxy-D-manno-octulosonic acid transferase [Alcaligenaceae bacterium]
MNRFFYTNTLRLISPVALWLLERRARKAGGKWEIRSDERFGRYSYASQDNNVSSEDGEGYAESVFSFRRPVWVHAVSLGETRAAHPLIQALLDQGYPVLLTHMTATGRLQGGRMFAEAIGQGMLTQAWVPYDFPEAVRGFIEHWKPRCGILIEREIWPNMVAEANRLKMPLIVASARFSESALKQAQWLGSVMRNALAGLDLVLTQTRFDSARLEILGVKRMQVVGNLKFDLNISYGQVHTGQVVREVINRQVLAIASTRDGEEESFLKVIKAVVKQHQIQQEEGRQVPDLPLFMIIPRHPQRFREVETLIQQSGLSYACRSQNPLDNDLKKINVLLCDSVGEMFFYYAMSDLAIVAGSFGMFGGQNHIEACALGVPVIVGPHTDNFEQAVDDALSEGAARRTQDAEEAILLALKILGNEEQRLGMSKAAKQWLSLHEGATDRIMSALKPYLR